MTARHEENTAPSRAEILEHIRKIGLYRTDGLIAPFPVEQFAFEPAHPLREDGSLDPRDAVQYYREMIGQIDEPYRSALDEAIRLDAADRDENERRGLGRVSSLKLKPQVLLTPEFLDRHAKGGH